MVIFQVHHCNSKKIKVKKENINILNEIEINTLHFNKEFLFINEVMEISRKSAM